MNKKYDRFGNKKKLNGKENKFKRVNSIERSWEKVKQKKIGFQEAFILKRF